MPSPLLSAREAARALGVRPETLYAYVSRGRLVRHRRPGDRASWFDPVEIDRLAGRGRGGPRGEREVRIASAITVLAGGHWFYRGRDPVALARAARFEQVAELLWTGTLPAAPVRWTADPAAVDLGRRAQRLLRPDALPADRVRLVTVALAGADPLRHDLRPEAVVATARRLLATLVECLPAAAGSPAVAQDASFAARLWSRVASGPPRPRAVGVLDAALVLLADHELAASTIAVRTAAALRADPYGAIGAGLGVLGGRVHGAISVDAEALLREIAAHGSVDAVLEAHVRRGESLPGVGHPMYPDGDPRARALLALLPGAGVERRRLRQVEALLSAARTRGLPPPNVDMGIAALAHVFGFAAGSGELVFALARMAGWVAHLLEEYAQPSTIRPRAVYTGPRPELPPPVAPVPGRAGPRAPGGPHAAPAGQPNERRSKRASR